MAGRDDPALKPHVQKILIRLEDAKVLVEDVFGKEIDHKLRTHTARGIARRRSSEEGREGLTAFLERRKPDWAE